MEAFDEMAKFATDPEVRVVRVWGVGGAVGGKVGPSLPLTVRCLLQRCCWVGVEAGSTGSCVWWMGRGGSLHRGLKGIASTSARQQLSVMQDRR